MRHCEFHPALIEQATFLAARRDSRTERALRAELENVYRTRDPDERDAHFVRIHGRWFAELELDQPLRKLLAEQPLIAERVARCHVREAPGRRRESVELFVRATAESGRGEERTLMIDLCPETLLDADRLDAWLRRELYKIADMVDDAFGYSPHLPQVHRSRQNLIRDRYRVLWDAYVEVRMRRAFPESAADLERWSARFRRAFSIDDDSVAAACLQYLIDLGATTHSRILGWAMQPDTLPGWRPAAGRAGHAAGEMCPLCCFPTYDWYDFASDVDGRLQRAIVAAHANWQPGRGACRQCVETYAAKDNADPAGEGNYWAMCRGKEPWLQFHESEARVAPG